MLLLFLSVTLMCVPSLGLFFPYNFLLLLKAIRVEFLYDLKIVFFSLKAVLTIGRFELENPTHNTTLQVNHY